MVSKTLEERNIPGMDKRAARFAEIEYAKNVKETLKRFLAYFGREKSLAGSMLIIVVLGTICGICAPSMQSQAIDMIAGTRKGKLVLAVACMSVFYLLYSFSQLLQGVISARLSQNIVRKMRRETFDKIMDLPIQYLDTHSYGDVMSRITNDIENVSSTISQSLPSLYSGVLTIIGTLSVMFIFSWELTLLSCASLFLTVLVSRFLSGKVRKFSRKRQFLLGQLNGTVEEMIAGYHTVAAYNHQDITVGEFCELSDELTKAGIRTEIFSGVMGPIMNSIGNIGFVIIAAFGGYFVTQGLISIGVISAFIVYAKQLSRPINEIAQIYGQIQTAIAGAERVFRVLDEESEDMKGEAFEESPETTVVFRNVEFFYQPKNPIIRNFSLTIPSGQTVALVGATGSGKTTIANLLMRFYDIEKGDIFINKQNLRDIARDSLRERVAIVLQDTILFSDTIRNNLLYGNENTDQEHLDKAVRLCRCENILAGLSQGWDTVLTGSGANISQGQRQLLAIARAFVINPRILILDEATSNVDTRTEKLIQDAIGQVMKGRTSIVIAHRLSTIRNADMIVVIDEGRIVESGKHEELLAKGGKYYELYMSQYAGFAI